MDKERQKQLDTWTKKDKEIRHMDKERLKKKPDTWTKKD